MDAYALRNRLGAIECKLCQTVHPSEANYLVHTRCRRHRQAVSRREERDTRRLDRSERPSSKAAPRWRRENTSTKARESKQNVWVQYWRLPGNQGLRFVTEQPSNTSLELLVVPQRDRRGQEVWLVPEHFCLILEPGVFVTRVSTRVLTERSGLSRFQVDLTLRRDEKALSMRGSDARLAPRALP